MQSVASNIGKLLDRVDTAAVEVQAVVEDRPSTFAPGTTSFMRLRQRMKVLLPQPEGPMIAVTWFCSTWNETSLSAGLPS